MKIIGTFNPTDGTVDLVLRERGPTIVEAIVQKINSLAIRLEAHIVGDKLQGQVLHHRSGTLASSIRFKPAHPEGTSIIAEVTGAGGPAWYGRLHEYGATFARHSTARFGRGFTKAGTKGRRIRSLEQRTMATYVRLPERSFMRSSLIDLKPRIAEELRMVLKEQRL